MRQGPARVSANIIFGFGHGKWTLVGTWNQLKIPGTPYKSLGFYRSM